MRPDPRVSCLIAILLLSGGGLFAADADLPRRAAVFLEKYCFECHDGQNMASTTLRGDDFRNLIAPRGNGRAYVKSGKPEDSLLWKRVVKEQNMPEEGAVLQPTLEEWKVLEDWIRAGAQPWPVSNRQPSFLDDRAVLSRSQKVF